MIAPGLRESHEDICSLGTELLSRRIRGAGLPNLCVVRLGQGAPKGLVDRRAYWAYTANGNAKRFNVIQIAPCQFWIANHTTTCPCQVGRDQGAFPTMLVQATKVSANLDGSRIYVRRRRPGNGKKAVHDALCSANQQSSTRRFQTRLATREGAPSAVPRSTIAVISRKSKMSARQPRLSNKR